ncbi:helix-turn-helix transcriptional regulator [Fulvivirga aurantia]|uniref:helix-turn-helix domain-containing protein n=1 Tax=Fulvivirga aurantia TaxID=2529383 RepID=UPI0031B59310
MIKNRNQELLDSFGSHLRKLRKHRGMSQEELAYEADIPISQVGRIERGEINVTISTLYLIAKAMNMELKDLVNFR